VRQNIGAGGGFATRLGERRPERVEQSRGPPPPPWEGDVGPYQINLYDQKVRACR